MESEIFNIFPYRSIDSNAMKGITRSPFILSKRFRDLLLNEDFHIHCNEFFPSNYILHLNRGVSSSINTSPASVELHRDIPYLHTPTTYPVALSFLTFLSRSKSPQLRIWPKSHKENFYSEITTNYVDLTPIPGQTIVFDCNLLHQSLPTEIQVHYILNMFSVPIIKPVVTYNSLTFSRDLAEISYRMQEVLDLIGYTYIPPQDDIEYLNTKK